MPTPPLKREVAEQTIKLVEKCIEDGFVIGGSPSAIEEAGRRLRVSSSTVATRLRGAKRLYGLEPKYEPPAQLDIPEQVESDRKKRLDRDLAAENKRLRDALLTATDIRGGIAGLFSEPPAPKHINIPKRKHLKQVGEVPILCLYDLQWGEVVNKARMGGVNSYNAAIAEARIGRWLAACIDLLTNHWRGPAPPKVYLTLGGDLVSGQIHDLPKTNDRSAPEAVRDLVGILKFAIEKLGSELAAYHKRPIPIECISIPGNHGRIGEFPDDKRYVEDSYDTLVAWMLETYFNRPGSNVTVTIPPSGDALVRIYGRYVLFSHGDRIGTKGGDGGAGVAAPCARGMRKVVSDYAQQGIPIYKVFIGHLHTALELEDGFVSSSLVGPNERGRFRFRFKSMPATQWLLTVHPVYGIAQRWQIHVGDASEGSIYEIPPGAFDAAA